MNSVSEKIDERILRLLGLEYTFDLDYDTYLTLIRTAMVSGANKLPQEELALLANERKRVRGKVGRFRPKRQKINANRIATTKFLKPSVQPISTPLLPAQIGAQSAQIQTANLSPLQGPLESIKKVLSDFLNFRKDENEDERKEYEKENRERRESGLEGLKRGMGAVADAAKKFVSPFQGIIDRIWRFIFFTLLGRAFTQLMDWFNNPENQKKIDVLKRFLKDWWPALLAAATLFLTPFGRFVRGVLATVGGLAGKIVSQIPKLSGAIKGLSRVLLNPWVAVPAAAVGLAAAANAVTGQQKAASVQAANKARAQTGRGLDVQGTDTMTDKVPSVGNMGPTTPYGLLQGAAGGGSVMNGYGGIDGNTGRRISGFGPDTQLIAAQPGEVVINKRTVDALGADTFLGLNQYYGGPGANQPKFGRLYNSGGIIGGLLNRFTKPKGLSVKGVQAGFTGMAKEGFEAIMGGDKFRLGKWKPQILGRGAYSAPTIQGAQRYAGSTGSLGGKQTPGGVVKTIVPGSARRINILEPQSAVKPATFDKGKILADKLLRGQYSNSRLANQLRMQLISGSASRVGIGMGRLLGGAAGMLNAPLIGDMLFPQGTSTYDQLSGPNAYYNAPGYKGPKPVQKMGGGLIKENTGKDIRGATADRQMIFAQPGEYVLPVNTVNRLGSSLIDKLVAMTDSDSTAAKLGYRTKNIPQIKPLSRNSGSNTITLPPITQSTGSGGTKNVGGSKVPQFSTVASSGADVRAMNASVYGIVG